MRRPVLAPLLTTLAAFQSHWLDDVSTGAPDGSGIAVSAIGTGLLLLGWWLWPRLAARRTLTVAWAAIAWVSVADLVGLQPDGSFAPSLTTHWASSLGPLATVAVTVALLASASGLWTLRRGGRRRALEDRAD